MDEGVVVEQVQVWNDEAIPIELDGTQISPIDSLFDSAYAGVIVYADRQASYTYEVDPTWGFISSVFSATAIDMGGAEGSGQAIGCFAADTLSLDACP